jgi:hypothetical protein
MTFPAHYGACHLCRRHTYSLLTYDGKPVCQTCAPLASTAKTMKLTDVEAAASHKASEMAGAYLDHLQKTDLAELTEEEWFVFLGEVLDGFSLGIREELNREPPF